MCSVSFVDTFDRINEDLTFYPDSQWHCHFQSLIDGVKDDLGHLGGNAFKLSP